jgi:hypothetical protein
MNITCFICYVKIILLKLCLLNNQQLIFGAIFDGSTGNMILVEFAIKLALC